LICECGGLAKVPAGGVWELIVRARLKTITNTIDSGFNGRTLWFRVHSAMLAGAAITTHARPLTSVTQVEAA
jgi:hypothetical protein